MEHINVHRLNVVSLNCVHLNVVGSGLSSGGKAYGGYVKKGLLFQLDCTKIPVGIEWHDCVAKSDKYATVASFTIADDGAIVTTSVFIPKLVGAAYYEVCQKNAEGEVITTTSTTKPTISGTIYAVRVYSEPVSGNAAIDQRRFVVSPVPENALVDIDGNYILDAEGNFIVDNN